MFDTRIGRAVWEFNDEIHGAQVSDVTISIKGVAAGAYENHLLVHDLSSVSFIVCESCYLSHTHIERAWREYSSSNQGSSSRTLLSVLTVDGFVHGLFQSIKDVTDPTFGRSASHRSTSVVQVPIAEYDWFPLPRSVLMLLQVDDASTTFSLWCYPNTPACVIHERHYGLTSVVQATDQTDQNPKSRQDLAIPGLLNACITPRNSLIYVFKPSILSRRRESRFEERFLTSEQDLAPCISKEGTTHGAVGSKWENTAIAVATQSESTELITLCTFKRNMAEVVKYTMDYE